MSNAAGLSEIFTRNLAWLTGGPRMRWLVISALLCTALPWFFSCPLYPASPESNAHWAEYWTAIEQRKIDHPLHDFTREFPPQSSEAKRNFRILVPLLAKFTGLGPTGLGVVRFGFQAVLILSLLLLAERITGDRATALFFALVVAGTQVGTEVWRDNFGWFDNCAHAFILVALLATRPWVAGLMLLLGLFVDERVLCALPLVLLFHWIGRSPRQVLAGVILALPAYLAIRGALSVAYGLRNPLNDIGAPHILLTNLANAPVAFWFSLEGGWLLMFALLGRPQIDRRVTLALFVYTGLVLVASGFVADFTRSATYAFPATFVAMALLVRSADGAEDPARLRRLAGWAALVSVVVPNGVVLGEILGMESSLPVRALQAWLRNS